MFPKNITTWKIECKNEAYFSLIGNLEGFLVHALIAIPTVCLEHVAGVNVANRVQPIRIHELKREDVNLFEAEMGGKIRAIDFIYIP